MAIRVDIKSEEYGLVVYLAGRLTGDEGTQLRNACDPIKGSFVLDLSKLLFANNSGIESIKALREKGAKIREASPFIQLLIDNTFSQEADGEKD